jgi:hypothetical protein
MWQIEQRRLWRPEDHPEGPQRGDCMAACIASIFELPYEDCAELDGTTRSLSAWLEPRFPGVYPLTRYLNDVTQGERIGDHLGWPSEHHERGYWLAGIWSSRIPDREMRGCGCASRVAGGDPSCEWCHGRPDERFLGIEWGLHMVVMENWSLVWDPHPERDPDAPLYIQSATTFHVGDPAKLIARCTRGACGEGLIDAHDCYHREAAGAC